MSSMAVAIISLIVAVNKIISRHDSSAEFRMIKIHSSINNRNGCPGACDPRKVIASDPDLWSIDVIKPP